MARRKPTFMVIDIKEILNDLQMGVIDVLFEKKDGTNRLVKATLQSSYFGKPFFTEEEKQQRANWLAEGEVQVPVLHVWDVENKDWVSFRSDKVLSVQLTNG